MTVLIAISITPTVAQDESTEQSPVEIVTTEAPTEAPTEPPPATEPPPHTETPIPAAIPTELPTEVPTELPTEIPTEIPTELPTATDVPTEMLVPSETLIDATEAVMPTLDALTPTLIAETLTPTATVALPFEPALSLAVYETFDSGDLSRWRLGAGWSLAPRDAGFALQLTDPIGAAQLVGNDVTDAAVDARFLAPQHTAQLMVRQSSSGGYTASLSPDGRVELSRAGVAVQTALVAPAASDQWRTLRLSAMGGALRVSVDGIEVIAFLDDAPLPAGAMMIAGAAQSAEGAPVSPLLVDDISLWQPATDVIPTEMFTETLLPTATDWLTPPAEETEAPLAPEPSLSLLYADNFDAGLSPALTFGDGWQAAAIDGNPALQAAEGSAPAQYVSEPLYNAASEARFNAASGTVQVAVRQNEIGGYVATLDVVGQVSLYRAGTVVEMVIVSPVTDAWVTLRLSAIEDTVRVTLNGVEVIATRDLAPLPPGAVGFGASSSALVDEFSVWVPADEMTIAPMAMAMAEVDTASAQHFVVNTTLTSQTICSVGGTCTLPGAILAANQSNGVDTISFNISGTPPFILNLNTSGLHIKQSVILDATTQPGYDGSPLIELRDPAGDEEYGIYVENTDNGFGFDPTLTVTIKGLAITGFNGPGILLGNGQNHLIEGNYVGVTTDLFIFANDSGISTRAPNVTFRNNLIGGNENNGLTLVNNGGRNGENAQIMGNVIIQNDGFGIWIREGSGGNTIGSPAFVDGNVISGNSNAGIMINGPGGSNIIQGNYIGTNGAGDAAFGNQVGIAISDSHGNQIGGTTDTEPENLCIGACNLISSNLSQGINIVGNNNIVEGNFIGTDVFGSNPLGNLVNGITINGSNNRVGGATSAARNLLSANGSETSNRPGVNVTGSSNRIIGNYIGTDLTGTLPLGNFGGGVYIGTGAINNDIGGLDEGEGNVIAFNDNPGDRGAVLIDSESAIGNLIVGNRIFQNAGLGIELYPIGVTPNDAGDGDNGANRRQNFPVITNVATTDTTTVSGTLNSVANQQYFIEFFANTACDPSGYGEGELLVGWTTVTTNGSGNAAFTATMVNEVPGGSFITGTATNATGNTSEFSACVRASADLAISKIDLSDPALPGANMVYTLTVTNLSASHARGVRVVDTLPTGVTYVGASPDQGSCAVQGNVVTCDLGTLTASASTDVDITVTVAGSAPNTFTNTATVSAQTPDLNAANNTASQSTSLRRADVAVTSTDSPDPVIVGAVLRYTLRVTNNGPFPATDVTLVDVLPAGVTLETTTNPAGTSCVRVDRTVTCQLGTINNAASASVLLDVRIAASTRGTLRNDASVSTSARDATTTNNAARASTTVNLPPAPGAPTLIAPANGITTNNTTPLFSWNAPRTAGGPFTYQIQLATNSAFTAGLQNFSVSSPSFTLTTPLTGGRKYWRVRARNIVNAAGAWSTARSVVIDLAPPVAPIPAQPANGSVVNTFTPALVWGAVSDAAQYRVDVNTASNFGGTMLMTDALATTTSYTLPGGTLPPVQGLYYWRVQARDAAGNWGGESAVTSFNVFVGTAPANGAFTSPQPTFTWVDAGAATDTLQVATDREFTNLVVNVSGLGTTSYSLPSPLNPGTYYWRVLIGSEDPSRVGYRTLFVGAEPAAPTLRSPGNGAATTDRTPLLRWYGVTPPPNVVPAGYQIQLSRSSNFSSGVLTFTVDASALAFTPTSSLAKATWYWRVRALFDPNSPMPGRWSATRNVKIQ